MDKERAIKNLVEISIIAEAKREIYIAALSLLNDEAMDKEDVAHSLLDAIGHLGTLEDSLS